MEVANRLLEHIEQGTAPWQKPWEAGQILPPINAVTGKPYRGVNYQNLMTLSPDPSDPRWCTYKQAREQGWQVREGSSGIPIEVWKEYEHKRTPEEIETIRQESGKSIQDIEKTEKRLGVRYYSVFHASQIEGILPLARPERGHGLKGRPDPRLDGLSEAMGIAVRRGGSKAFYRPGEDFVQMPRIEDFHTATGHDTTLLHELSHATGHPQRLNREFGKTFGDQKYAIEELRAEMSAAMTAAALGIGFDPAAQTVEEGRETGNSAAYLASWLGTLPEKERKQILIQAIKDAQAISDFLIERTPALQVEPGRAPEPAPEADPSPEIPATKSILTQVPDDVRPFLGVRQAAVTDELLGGEEKAFFSDKMRELQEILRQMPATYESDGLPDGERPVSLRYFGPNGAQWFIIEKDRGDPENEGPGFPRQIQAFGLADLGMGYPEMGYISIPEITRAGAELDYHFTPTTLLEIKREHYPDLLPKEQEPEQPTAAMADLREQALAAYQAFYDALPERAEALIQRTMEVSKSLAPADFAGHEKMLREYRADVDETFGIIREGEYRGSSRPEVELMQALPGESIYNIPEVKARFAQSLPVQDRIGETRHALESDFKNRLKKHGKELLESGSLQDPKEITLACLWKSGAVVRPGSGMADKFVQAVEDRNLEHVIRWIGTNSQNPGSEEAFSRLTGVKLGKTQKERVAQLQEWAGPDRVAAMEQAHAERREKREEERKVRGVTHAWGNLQSFRVHMGDDRIIDGQSYVAEKVAQGQDHVVSRKEGAVTAYYLLNPETRDLSGVRKPAFTQYAKAVLALNPEGDVRKAMERAGLSQHLPIVEKPPVEPSGVPDPASERETTDPFEAKRRAVVQALESLGWEKRPGEPEGGNLLKKAFLVRKDPAKGGEYFRGKAGFETQADAHVRTNGIRVEFGDNPYFVTDPTAITVGRTAPAPEAVAERIDAQTKAQIAKAFEHLGVTAVVDGGTKSIPGKPEPSRDPASALHELSRALDALNGHTLPVTQKDGTQKTVAARDYLEAGLGRGMTATEDLGSAVRWYNPEHGTRFSRTITDDKLAAALKQAAAVDRNVGNAIHAAQRSKVNELEFE
ncbi:MAG: zincin-like metallopeptidase domain-containing protein [Acidithiobacillus sp.]|nr:zincin-like metallopeptidase domain-containing protein [Acidithiobacillus sp. S30A2]MDA8154250.1 zincin-like metallopeptidase domain-containing protein [Acidithiobacillus sp.]